MNEFRFTAEIKERTDEIAKKEALKIDPKNGTSIGFLQYYVIASWEVVKRKKQEAEEKINANNETYAPKVAEEYNAPIIAELNEAVKAIKENVRNHVNGKIDAREQRINTTRNMPIRDSQMKLLQTIRMLTDMNADIAENDWKTWAEQFAGHYLEEKVFASLAKTRDITILPSFDPVKSTENLETFRQMANYTIDRLENAEDNITALSFLNVSQTSPLGELIQQIDSDIASIIPAERLTVLKRLKDAKKNAYDADDIALSVRIERFIDKNADKLASPEEINESLYAEAEDFITQGMSAKR